MYKIQVTDKNQPERNIFQVGEVNFALLWDALLRAKVVVEEASILNIQALSPRAKPGYVVPPSPPSKGPSAIEKLENQVLEQTKGEFDQNILGDVAHVIDGVNPEDQLKNIENELKASVKIKELEKALKEKEALWKKRIAELPQGKEIDALGKRLKALKFDTKNPAQFAASLKEAEKILKEADQKIKLVDQTGKDLKGDVGLYTKEIQGLEDLVKQDLKDLQARLKIPDLNTKDFTKKLLGGMFQSKLIELQKYMAIGRQYMPPKKTEEEKAANRIIPPPRGEGINYKFPITKGYPLFWLKHAAISSEPNESEYSGRLSGEITNATTDPSLIGKPLIAKIEGEFPKKQIFGFQTVLTIDHVTENAIEDLLIKVGSFPIGKQKLSDSKDVRFVINSAKAESTFNAHLENQSLRVTLDNQFKEMVYDIDSKSKLVKEILTNIMGGIPVITLNARAGGTWQNLDIGMNSNLGDKLAEGFKAELQARINEAKAKIQKIVDEKIGAEKAKLTAEFDKVKNQVNGLIDSKKGEVEKAKKQAEAEFKKQKDSGQKKEIKKLENEGKKFLKGLKF